MAERLSFEFIITKLSRGEALKKNGETENTVKGSEQRCSISRPRQVASL